MENCQELILESVVRIDIYQQSKITFSVPYNALAAIEAECVVASGADPVLTLKSSETAASNVVMDASPKLQVTEKREAAGLIRTHNIEAVIKTHFKTVQASVDNLVHDDIVAIMTAYDGTRFTIIPFPNTSTLSLSDEQQDARAMTLRYSAQSFSGIVKLTSWSTSSSDSSD